MIPTAPLIPINPSRARRSARAFRPVRGKIDTSIRLLGWFTALFRRAAPQRATARHAPPNAYAATLHPMRTPRAISFALRSMMVMLIIALTPLYPETMTLLAGINLGVCATLVL